MTQNFLGSDHDLNNLLIMSYYNIYSNVLIKTIIEILKCYPFIAVGYIHYTLWILYDFLITINTKEQ